MNRLFLVDDHQVLREGLRALLEPEGFNVVGEGWELPQVLHDILRLDPDVVLLDLSLGTRSGLELLAELTARRATCRVVVLTMHRQARQVIDAVRLGATGYVLKGAPGAEVVKAIRWAAAGQHYWCDEVRPVVRDASATESPASPLEKLSRREHQVLRLVIRGHSSAAIAIATHLSAKSVDTYRSRIMRKVGVQDLTALVRWSIKVGVLDVDEE